MDPDLKAILLFAQKAKLLRINLAGYITLYEDVKKDIDNEYFAAAKRLKEIKTTNLLMYEDFLRNIFCTLFYTKYNTQAISFLDLISIFNATDKKVRINTIQNSFNAKSQKNPPKLDTSAKKDNNDLFLEPPTDPSEGSDPRLKTPTARWEQLAKLIENKKIEMGIWISKLKRDHNTDPMGKIDPTSELFKSLCNHYSLDFSNKSGYAAMVGQNKGICFRMTMNKNGYIHMWVNQTRGNYDWQMFVKQFFSEFNFLPFEHQSHLLECFEYSKDHLFLLETANTIGPKPLIDTDWKGACVICKQLLWKNKLHDVMVWIDYSMGPSEIEFFGPEEPCRLMQELLTMPYEVAQSMGRFESILEEFLTRFEFNETCLNDIASAITTNTQNIYKRIDSNHDDLKQTLTDNQNQLITTLNNNGNQTTQLVQVIHKSNTLFQDRFDNVDGEIATMNQSLEWFEEEHQTQLQQQKRHLENKIVEAKNEIVGKIDEIDKSMKSEFEDLKKIINDNFTTQNERLKFHFYIIVRTLEKLPGQTVDQLSEALRIPAKTLNRNLNQLREKGLLETKKKELIGKRGRPKLKLFVTNLINFLK